MEQGHQSIPQREKRFLEIQLLANPGAGKVHGEDSANSAGIKAQHHDPAGQEDRLFHIVGNEEDGLALFGVLLPEAEQQVLKPGSGDGVQRSEGFVHKKHWRIDGKSPGNGGPLAHPAGKLARQLVTGGGQSHHLQVALGDLPVLFLFLAGESLTESKDDVLSGGHPGEERVILKNYSPIQPRTGNRFTVHGDGAGRRNIEPRQQPEEGTLAASRRSKETDKFSRLGGEGDVPQDFVAAVGVRDRVDCYFVHDVIRVLFGSGLSGSCEVQKSLGCPERGECLVNETG